MPTILIVIVEKTKDCSSSSNRDGVGSTAKFFLRIGGLRLGSNVKADACCGGGNDSGKGKKCSFHNFLELIAELSLT
jgi:hypothetical protein